MASEGQGVKLHGVSGSPFSGRVELALHLKDVSYELVQEDLSNKSPELIKYNPVHKKIPVLVHDGKPLAESLLIVQYIDETWKDTYPILPQDPYQKAVALFWAKFIDEKCLPSLWQAYFSDSVTAAAEASENLKLLEEQLEGKRFFGGGKVGYLDIAANFIAYWTGVAQEAGAVQVLTPEKFPTLTKWGDDFTSVVVGKQSLPPRENLVAYYRGRLQAGKTAK